MPNGGHMPQSIFALIHQVMPRGGDTYEPHEVAKNPPPQYKSYRNLGSA
jgi:hypothetical protein